MPLHELIDVVGREDGEILGGADQIGVFEHHLVEVDRRPLAHQTAKGPLLAALLDLGEHLVEGVVDQAGEVGSADDGGITGAVRVDLLCDELDRQGKRGLPEGADALGDDREQQETEQAERRAYSSEAEQAKAVLRGIALLDACRRRFGA